MPQLVKVYQSDFFLVEIDHSLSLLRSEWLRAVTDEELKEAAMQLKEAITANEVKLLLANACNLNALSSGSKEWLSSYYYNLLSATGVRKMARILPTNLFRQIPLEAVVTRADALSQLQYEVKNFQSEAEGLRWLLD